MKQETMFRRLLKTAAIVMAAAAMTLLLEGAISSRYLYYIKNDGRTRIVYTSSTDPAEIMQAAGRELGPYDYGQIEPDEEDEDTFTLYIIHGMPVYVQVDGERREIIADEGMTYAEAIRKAGIEIGEEDIISRDLDEEVEDGGEVQIQRVTYSDWYVSEALPYDTEYEPTRHLPEGKVKHISAGKSGEKRIWHKDKLIDGVQVETAVDHEEITRQPVDAAVQIGDADAPVTYIESPDWLKLDENGNPVSYKEVITGKGTAYSASAGAYGASGRFLHTGYVAVNPEIIPYGSKLYIKSSDGSYVYGYAIAADTGIALLDGRVLVDVYFNNYADACKFGAKKVDVYVLE